MATEVVVVVVEDVVVVLVVWEGSEEGGGRRGEKGVREGRIRGCSRLFKLNKERLTHLSPVYHDDLVGAHTTKQHEGNPSISILKYALPVMSQ